MDMFKLPASAYEISTIHRPVEPIRVVILICCRSSDLLKRGKGFLQTYRLPLMTLRNDNRRWNLVEHDLLRFFSILFRIGIWKA